MIHQQPNFMPKLYATEHEMIVLIAYKPILANLARHEIKLMFSCTLLYVPSSFAIILMGKRELIALISLSSWCLVIVVWLLLAVQSVCLEFVIVVFLDHSHLLFLI